MSAYELNKPDKIYIYITQEQYNDFFWDILKDIPEIEFEYVEERDEYKGAPLASYQYKADVIRMEKLIERGGVYMDLDILSLKPVTNFLTKKLVVGGESQGDTNSNGLDSVGSVANGVLISEPNNPFIMEWLKRIPDNIVGKPWAYHAVNLPKNILAEGNYDIHLEPTKSFFPFCFRYHYIFRDNMKDKITELMDSYTIHLWETIWHNDYISKFSVKYFSENDNIFTWLFGKYLRILHDNLPKLDNIIERAHTYNWNKLLLKYCDMYIDLCYRYGDKIDSKYPYYKLIASHGLNDAKSNSEALNTLKSIYNELPSEYTVDKYTLT